MKPLAPLKTRVPLAAKIRLAVASKFEIAAEVLGLVFAASGATLAAILGKFIIGVVLAALAVGFLLRLKGRKAQGPEKQQVRASTAARLLTGLVSVCEVAALVEVTNIPVRFDQPGSFMGHWYLVLLALFAAYMLQLSLFAKLLTRRHARSAA